MKTNLFIAALSLVVLAGCSGEDEIDTLVAKSDNAINFGTYVGKQTKATERSAFIDNDEIGVFAFYTKSNNYDNATSTPNFMYEQSIKKETAGWTYNPVKYWPNTSGEKITFFAYYPAAKTGMTFQNTGTVTAYANTSKGFPDIKFVVQDDAKNQIDFMYSTLLNKEKPASTGKIDFGFAHALSKVNIKAQMEKTLNNTTTVNIKSVTLNNIYNTNTLKYTGTPTPSWGWDSASSEKTYTITLNNTSLTSTNGMNAIDITSGETSFLMVPQTLSTAADKKASITITYDVVTTDTNLSGGSTTITNTVTKDIATSPSPATWAMNKQYVYTILISLTDVSVDSTVANWETTE